MNKLIAFLKKEVPSDAKDLYNSINNMLEIIKHTRNTLSYKYIAIAKNFL